jgi:hypothetical protein
MLRHTQAGGCGYSNEMYYLKMTKNKTDNSFFFIVYSTSSCVIWAFFGTRGPLKLSFKMFKISLTFRFDKLSNLSKSVHTGENSQILRVPNKKTNCCVFGCNTCRKNEPEACFIVSIYFRVVA